MLRFYVVALGIEHAKPHDRPANDAGRGRTTEQQAFGRNDDVTDTFDFVVVGGGLGRLRGRGAAVGRSQGTSVALLEAGGSERQLGGHHALRAGR